MEHKIETINFIDNRYRLRPLILDTIIYPFSSGSIEKSGEISRKLRYRK
jgi:hypothetical protein